MNITEFFELQEQIGFPRGIDAPAGSPLAYAEAHRLQMLGRFIELTDFRAGSQNAKKGQAPGGHIERPVL